MRPQRRAARLGTIILLIATTTGCSGEAEGEAVGQESPPDDDVTAVDTAVDSGVTTTATEENEPPPREAPISTFTSVSADLERKRGEAARPPVPAPAPEIAAEDSGPTWSIPVVFDPPELDFGIVPPGPDVHGSVMMLNTGTEPLRVRAVRPSCKCTTIGNLAGRTIPPGGSLELKAVLDITTTTAPKTSRVRVLFDGYDDAASLFIRALVAQPVRAEPPYLNTIGQSMDGTFVVSSIDERPFRVLSVNMAPPVFADGFDPEQDEPRTSYTIPWDLSRYSKETCLNPEGKRVPRYWLVETDHPDAPLVDLRVRHPECTLPENNGIRTWYIGSTRHNFGNFEAGEWKEFTLAIKWRKGRYPIDPVPMITSAHSESGAFRTELLKVWGEGREKVFAKFRVQVHPDHRGPFVGTMRIYGSAPDLISAPYHLMGRAVAPATVETP